MAQYNISVAGTVIGVVDSQGQNQPFSSAHKPYPISQSVSPMGNGSGSGAGVPGSGSDVSNTNSTTQSVSSNRA
jgi:hypothetical protein